MKERRHQDGQCSSEAAQDRNSGAFGAHADENGFHEEEGALGSELRLSLRKVVDVFQIVAAAVSAPVVAAEACQRPKHDENGVALAGILVGAQRLGEDERGADLAEHARND